MGKVVASDNIAGGTSSALQTDFPTSVTQVFADPPKAAQVLEGDFVGGVIADETTAEPRHRLQRLRVPGDQRLRPGRGRRRRRDGHVQGQPGRAGADRVPRHARGGAEIWAAKGGFSSPNKNVDPEVYPDELTKQTATELANAEVFRFDMSDLMPGAFGSDSLFTLLQDFVQEPGRRRRDRDQARGGGGVRVQVGVGAAEVTRVSVAGFRAESPLQEAPPAP